MIYDTLQELSIPVAYGRFKTSTRPPYVVYMGTGQDTFGSDNTWYYRNGTYQIEYYYTKKNEEVESEIEDLLLSNGYNYVKSEDVYIDDEDVFVIYYNV